MVLNPLFRYSNIPIVSGANDVFYMIFSACSALSAFQRALEKPPSLRAQLYLLVAAFDRPSRIFRVTDPENRMVAFHNPQRHRGFLHVRPRQVEGVERKDMDPTDVSFLVFQVNHGHGLNPFFGPLLIGSTGISWGSYEPLANLLDK
jgi:hypothetical protein